MACYSHFKEVADLTNELEICKNRCTRNKNANNVQLTNLGSEMDVDATFTEHDDLGGDDRRMDDELFVEEYEGAAKEYGSGMTFIDEFNHDQFAGEHIDNLYYPFTSRDKWEFAAFLLCSDLSMASIDSLLLLNLVSVTCNFDRTYIGSYLCIKKLKLSFGTARKLQGLAEMLPKGPAWQCKVWTTVYLTKRNLTLFFMIPLNAYNTSSIALL